MKLASQKISVFTLVLFITASSSWAAGAGNLEEMTLISNGNGVSAPSFSDGLSGENPAGLAWNQRIKIGVAGAAYNNSFSPVRGAVGATVGNGLFGAGLEFSKFSSHPLSNSGSLLNWGLAGVIQAINLTAGVSGHHSIPGGGSSFDLGLLYEPVKVLRFGFMIPNFTNSVDDIALGLTYALDRVAELVVDADYSIDSKSGVVKPGLTFHFGPLHLSGAYGLNYVGTSSGLLSKEFTAGLGFKITDAVLFSYEYQGLPLHRAGLTLRLN